MSRETRVLGIDPGERRVGIAVSDPLGITAQGLDTFDLATDGDLLARLATLIAEYNVTRIVIGHPRALSGRATRSTGLAEALARRVSERFRLDVVMWDERLSSVEANRVLAGTRADKKDRDRVAAVLILQGYLDSRYNGD